MEQKFNKGDLVQIESNGVRLFVVNIISGGSERPVNLYDLGMMGNGEPYTVIFAKSERNLTLIQPAKEYIEVNGHKVPKPLSEKPKNGFRYYGVQIDHKEYCNQYIWADDNVDNQFFERGLVFENREDAIAMSKALLSAIPKQ